MFFYFLSVTADILSYDPSVFLQASSVDYTTAWKRQTFLKDAVDNDVRIGLYINLNNEKNQWFRIKFVNPCIVQFFILAMWSHTSVIVEIGNGPSIGENPRYKSLDIRRGSDEFIMFYDICNEVKKWVRQYFVLKSEHRFMVWEIQVYGENINK